VVTAACGGGISSPSPARSAKCPVGVPFDGTVDDHGALTLTGPSGAVEAGDAFFAPTCLTGAPSGTLTLTVKNTGKLLHNVSVPAQSIDVDVAAGQTITVKITVGAEPISYFCKYHRTSGMLGAIVPGR